MEGMETAMESTADTERPETHNELLQPFLTAETDNADTKKRWSRKKKICVITSSVVCLVVSVAVFLTLLFVVAPKLVQKFMNDAELQFVSIGISNPHPDSFTLSSHCILSNAGIISSTIRKFNVTIEYNGELLGHMGMPEVQTKGEAPTDVYMQSVISIDNVDVFNSFSEELVRTHGTAVWRIFGNATVHALGLSFSAFFDKNVTIGGMQGLSNVTVLSFDLPRNNPDTTVGGVEMFVNVTMYNPSVVTMNMESDVTFEMIYEGSSLGQLISTNVTLAPGANFLMTRGYLKPQNLTSSSRFMSNYLLGVDSLVGGIGLHASPGAPAWVQNMVKILGFTTVFQGGKGFPPVISNIQLQSMGMDVVSGNSILASSAMQSGFFTPFNFPLAIVEVKLSLEMVLDGKAFASVDVPYSPARSNQTLGLFWSSFDKVPMDLTDMGVFSQLVNLLAMSASAQCEFRGTGTATVATSMGNITLIDLPFAQNVTISGMQGLSNVTILGFDLPRNNPDVEVGGVEMFANVTMYNPSFVTMALGADVVMDIFFEGNFISRVSAPNVTLYPGANILSSRGYLKPQNLTSASKFISNYMTGIDSIVSGLGVSIGNSSDPSTAWMQEMVKLITFSTTFPGARGLQSVFGIKIDAMSITMNTDTDISTNAQVTSGFRSPFAFPLSIAEAQLSVNLTRDDVIVAILDIPPQPARSNSTLGLLWTQFQGVPMRVMDQTHFGMLVDDLTNTPNVVVVFQGTATVKAETAMGNVTISNIPFNVDVDLQGLNSFSGQVIQIPTVSVNGGSPAALELGLDLILHDPSYLSLSAANISFVTLANNEIYINHTTPEFSVTAGQDGTIHVSSSMIKSSQSEGAINDMLSSYIRGDQVLLNLQGRPNDCRLHSLRPALEHVQLIAVMQTQPIKMASYIQMTLSWDNFKGIIPSKVTMTNPWKAVIKVVGMALNVYSEDDKIAEVDIDISNDPIVLPGLSTIVSSAQPVKVVGVSYAEIKSVFTKVPLRMSGAMSVVIGDGFRCTIQYSQDGVPAGFHDD